MTYVDNLVQGVALAERHSGGARRAFWVADREGLPTAEVVATVVGCSPRRVPRARRRGPVPGGSPRGPSRRPGAPGPRALLPAGPRPGRAGRTIRCDITADGRRARLRPAGRPGGGDAALGALVRAPRHRHRAARPERRAEVGNESHRGLGHRGQRLLRFVAGRPPARCRLPGADVRSGRCRRPSGRGGARPGRHPRPRPVARRSSAWTSCSTTSRRCRWPGTANLFESVNVGGTAVLLAACERAGVAKVVHTSSSAVFGVPRANPVTRDTEPAPVEPYGRAKLDAELLCRAAVSRGLDVSIIRPRTILGHGRLGIFGILFDWVARARRAGAGAGDNVYQFVHAADLADACLRAAGGPGPPSTTSAPNGSARCARPSRRCARTPAPVRGCAASGRRRPLPRCGRASLLGLSPLAPYHWIMYGRSIWFDVTPARAGARGGARASRNEEMLCDSYDWYLAHRRGGARRGDRPRSWRGRVW